MPTDTAIELDNDFYRDPYAFYERIRPEGGVHKVRFPNGTTGWLITDYALVKQVLTEPTILKDAYSDAGIMAREGAGERTAVALLNRHVTDHMLNADPPKHTRLRSLVNKAFTTRAVKALEPRITEIANGLLDALEGETATDLLDSYAFPLPITVICELLGVPLEDRDRFRLWSNAVVNSAAPDEMSAASDRLDEYLTDLIAKRAVDPGDDMLSELIAVTEDGDRLKPDELVSMAFLLLIAGHETTVNLIGNATLMLLDRPELQQSLRADPSRIPAFVEEALRYDGPVHIGTLRYTTEPIVLGGKDIGAHEIVLVSLTGANRDQQRFENSDTVDASRARNSHVAFGYGIHHCVGAPLARLEGRIALDRLLDRFPELALDTDRDTLDWRSSLLIRGLTSLPVRLTHS